MLILLNWPTIIFGVDRFVRAVQPGWGMVSPSAGASLSAPSSIYEEPVDCPIHEKTSQSYKFGRILGGSEGRREKKLTHSKPHVKNTCHKTLFRNLLGIPPFWRPVKVEFRAIREVIIMLFLGHPVNIPNDDLIILFAEIRVTKHFLISLKLVIRNIPTVHILGIVDAGQGIGEIKLRPAGLALVGPDPDDNLAHVRVGELVPAHPDLERRREPLVDGDADGIAKCRHLPDLRPLPPRRVPQLAGPEEEDLLELVPVTADVVEHFF